MDPMLGMIFMVPWNWAPYNYQLCQGQTVNLQQYEALFSLMGTVFGGNGTSTFALPNLATRTPVGTGVMNTTSYTLGAYGGTPTTTLVVNNLPIHNHSASFAPISGPQVISIPATTGNLGVTASLPLGTGNTGSATPAAGNNYLNAVSGTVSLSATSTKPVAFTGPFTTAAPAAGASLPATASLTGTAGSGAATVTISTVTGGTVTTGLTGSNTPFTNMPPYLALSFVIAMNGLYPDRP